MRSNLHLHSRYSDGTQWPAEIAAAAKACGLEQASLMDHDSLEGVPEFLRACEENGLAGVPGAEIDCEDGHTGASLELLAYFPSGRFENTRRLLRERIESRRRTAIECLGKHFSTGLDDLERLRRASRQGEADPPRLTYLRPHLFHYARSKGLAPARMTLSEFKAAYYPDTGKRLEMREVVAVVKGEAGLIAVPHPGHLFPDGWAGMLARPGDLREKLARLKEAGAWGVELYHYADAGDRNAEANDLVGRTAEDLGLRLTSGSDHHGPPGNDDGFGCPRDTLALPPRDIAPF